AGGAVLEAATDADDAHRQVVQDGTIADELVAAERSEGHDGVDEREEAGLGKPGGQTDHVLFGDADIDKSIGEAVGKRLQRHEAEISGQKQDARVALRQLGKGRGERRSHAEVSISRSAWRYSSSLIGR